MTSKTSKMRRLFASSLSLLAAASLAGHLPAAMAVDAADDVGVFGSLTVARQAREAAKAMKSQDFATAANLYRQAAATQSDFPLFYYGMYYCASKAGQWDLASSALDGIAEKQPADVPHLAYEFGHTYTMQNRFDDAVPKLKEALAHVNTDNSFLTTKLRELQAKTDEKAPVLVPGMVLKDGTVVPEPPKEKAAFVVPTRELISADSLNPDKNDTGRDYENAFRQSEFICIAEYKGYEKKDNIGFYIPPTANFRIIKQLKGYAGNKDLPLKFKFYDHDGVKPPEGWKFGPDKMPKVGSQWIIFIPNFIPIAGQGFDTFKGDYGRQEATPENLGKIYQIIEAHHGQM